MQKSSVYPHHISQRHVSWNQKSPIWTPEQRTHWHWSNVHCSCFLAQASLLLLLVSFSSGFFAAIRPWRPDSHSLLRTVVVMMCLLLELCDAFTWAAISEAGNCNELINCSSVTVFVVWRRGIIGPKRSVVSVHAFFIKTEHYNKITNGITETVLEGAKH